MDDNIMLMGDFNAILKSEKCEKFQTALQLGSNCIIFVVQC